jgi:hypothetical protein
MDLANYSLFGDVQNTSAIPASVMSVNADGDTDWNAVLASGIRGAAQAAIAASVGQKFADGQLVAQAQQKAQSDQMRNLLIMGVIAYLVLHS